MSKIEIELDQVDYAGGDEVTGRVVLDLDEPIPSRGIRARFEGYERAYWVRGYGKNGSPNWETRPFFDEEKTLHGHPPLSTTEVIQDAIRGIFSKDNYEILTVGKHAFPFSFQLPDALPGDYESPKASTIRYEITAYVDIPLKVDLKTSRRLTIYESYDREALAPVEAEASKTFLLDDDAPLDVTLRLDRNMYHPGDELEAFVCIQNSSSRKLEKLCLEIVQIEELQAQNLTEEERYEMLLVEHEAPVVAEGEEKELSIKATLPNDLYATITSGELVRVSYALVLRVGVAWGGDLSVELPIVLLEEGVLAARVHDERRSREVVSGKSA